jgi:predicted PurR-regulated permease PerM
MKIASQVVVILFLSIFISSIFSSVLNLLQKKNFLKNFSYLIILLIILTIGLMLVYVVNISLKDFLTNLPFYEDKLKNLILNSTIIDQDYGLEIDRTKFLLIIIGVVFIFTESKSFQTKLRVIFRNNAKN